MAAQDQLEQSGHFQQLGYIYSIGFFGGLFASMLAYIAHVLNFLPFGPGIIFQNMAVYETLDWIRRPPGHLLGVVVISLFSIAFAFLYYFLFRRVHNGWVGISYGLALWVILFLGVNELLPGIQSVGQLGWNTNIVLVCIFALYGLFIGYSISYESQHGHNKGNS